MCPSPGGGRGGDSLGNFYLVDAKVCVHWFMETLLHQLLNCPQMVGPSYLVPILTNTLL